MNQERGKPLRVVERTKDERGKVATRMMFYFDLTILYLWLAETTPYKILAVLNCGIAVWMIFSFSKYAFILSARWNQLKRVSYKRYEL